MLIIRPEVGLQRALTYHIQRNLLNINVSNQGILTDGCLEKPLLLVYNRFFF